LFGFVVMAKFEDSRTGDVADTGGSLDIGGIIVGIVAQAFHQWDVDGIRIDGQDVDKRTKRGIADGLFFVSERPLRCRTTQGTG
jgi:hypothetical protein